MTEQGRMRVIEASDLDVLLAWRNSPSVRRFMYTSHLIKPDEHKKWFESVCHDDNRHPLIFMLEGVPSGFVNIGPVHQGGIADWGFYTAPETPKGTGKLMGRCALEYAFGTLKLHKICGEALAYNEASQRFHTRLGFQREGELVDQYFDGARFYNVIRFGLIASDWEKQLREKNNESKT